MRNNGSKITFLIRKRGEGTSVSSSSMKESFTNHGNCTWWFFKVERSNFKKIQTSDIFFLDWLIHFFLCQQSQARLIVKRYLMTAKLMSPANCWPRKNQSTSEINVTYRISQSAYALVSEIVDDSSETACSTNPFLTN